jgi:hypothetical protein
MMWRELQRSKPGKSVWFRSDSRVPVSPRSWIRCCLDFLHEVGHTPAVGMRQAAGDATSGVGKMARRLNREKHMEGEKKPRLDS